MRRRRNRSERKEDHLLPLPFFKARFSWLICKDAHRWENVSRKKKKGVPSCVSLVMLPEAENRKRLQITHKLIYVYIHTQFLIANTQFYS
jgi:hypothetical protein